jgi:hypothetical protein
LRADWLSSTSTALGPLDTMADEFGISHAMVWRVITITPIGYELELLLISGAARRSLQSWTPNSQFTIRCGA